MQNLNSKRGRRFYLLILGLGCIAFVLALGSYMIIGSYMRYNGDDYCYGAVLTEYGFWKAQWHSYFYVTPYAGNRYSLNLLSGIAGMFPPIANGIIPGLTILLWVMGLTLAIRNLAELTNFRLHWLEILLWATFLVFITLYMAPDIDQSLYWRSGMLPYTMPLIVNTYLAGLILSLMKHERVSRMILIGIAFLAFFAGGFSETAAALQACGLVVASIAAYIGKKRSSPYGSRAFLLAGVALLGTLLALLGLILSPTNKPRQMPLPTPPDPVTLTSLSLRFALDFIESSLTGLRTPHIILFIFSLILSIATLSNQPRSAIVSRGGLLAGIVVVPILCYGLIAGSFTPFSYAQSAYPEPRALITARYLMVLAITSLSFLLALGIQTIGINKRTNPTHIALAAAVLLGIMSLYSLRGAMKIITEVPEHQSWAASWDERDQEIRREKERGVINVEVIKLNTLIPRVGELSPDSDYWYNQCAAGYYGVNSISANKSGEDE